MNKGVQIAIVLVLLVAACWYGYTKWKSLNPPAPPPGQGQMMPGMMPGGPGMPPGGPGGPPPAAPAK